MNFDQLAAHGSKPQVAPTMAGAQLSNISDPQMRLLLVALQDGVVFRGGGEREGTILQLNACGRKKLLKLVAHPGSRRSNWHYGTLTNTGRKVLEAHLASLAQ